jgi:hypothetical protein
MTDFRRRIRDKIYRGNLGLSPLSSRSLYVYTSVFQPPRKSVIIPVNLPDSLPLEMRQVLISSGWKVFAFVIKDLKL